MRLKVLLPLLFLGLVLPLNPFYSNAQDWASHYPTLKSQLQNQTVSDFDLKQAEKNLTLYLQSDNPEIKTGMKMILLEEPYKKYQDPRANHALTLLLYLLSKDCFSPHDSITLALALANNHIYSRFDADSRQQIKLDLEAHYQFYLKIQKEQKTWKFKYSLAQAPLYAKILWANRSPSILFRGLTQKYNLAEYKEFIDRVDTLEYLHQLAHDKNWSHAADLPKMLHQLSAFVLEKRKFASNLAMICSWHLDISIKPDKISDEQAAQMLEKNQKKLPLWAKNVLSDYRAGNYYIDVFGRKVDVQYPRWTNYQVRLYQEKGEFKGDCSTLTVVNMAMLKALGIPASYIQDHEQSYALYYNLQNNTWHTIEPVNIPKKIKNTLIRFVLHKIKWHHNLPKEIWYFYTRSTLKNYYTWLTQGISGQTYLNYFYLEKQHAPEILLQ